MFGLKLKGTYFLTCVYMAPPRVVTPQQINLGENESWHTTDEARSTHSMVLLLASTLLAVPIPDAPNHQRSTAATASTANAAAHTATAAAASAAAAATDDTAAAPKPDAGFAKFLNKFESPQWEAVSQMMANPMTLTQLRRLATDPTALAAAARLRGEAMRNPHMLAMLRDQEHRILADPRLSQTMARMQRVLEAPHEPLPAAADDGLPTPHMSLDDLLGDDAKRQQLRALAEHASARPAVRERMAAMLRDPSVQQRLRSLQADIIEDPRVWARLLQTFGAQIAPATATEAVAGSGGVATNVSSEAAGVAERTQGNVSAVDW